MGKPTEQRKAEIIQSTLELAARQGVCRVTTLAIADEVGIAHATVFRHFKTREAIFSAALKWIVENMFAALEPHFTSQDPADERLHALINTQLNFVNEHRGLPRLLFSDRLHMESEELKGIVRHAMEQFTSRIADLISKGMDEGVFDPDVQPKNSAIYLIALFQGLMMRWSIFDFEFQIEKESEPLWTFFSSSLKPD
jgi:AcrR family transcriptional regulator